MRNARLILVLMFLSSLLLGCDKAPQSSPNYFATTSGTDVKPGYKISFPSDHGAHNEQGIEWWYVTGNLSDNQGNEYGIQWTLFRIKADNPKIDSPWWDDNFYFAHFALQSDKKHQAFERSGRAQQVVVQSSPFIASIDDWTLKSTGENYFPLQLKASGPNTTIDLELSGGPLILHGEQGFSQKTEEGHASYYYSYPLMSAKGVLRLDNKDIEVSGSAWLDREWSGGLMGDSYQGWDWFSIQSADLQSGLMAFCLRGRAQDYQYCSGSKFDRTGKVTKIEDNEITLTPSRKVTLDGKTYPTAWSLQLNNQEPIYIEAVNPDSRNKLSIPYWEGRIRISGGFVGKGYAELVGY